MPILSIIDDKEKMSNKKYLYGVSATIVLSALLLTGCATGSSNSANDTTNNTPTVSVPAAEGKATLVSFASIYEKSLLKAKQEGVIETIVSPEGTIEYIYDPNIDKKIGVVGAQGMFSTINLIDFPMLSIASAIVSAPPSDVTLDAKNNTQGVYTFISQDETTGDTVKLTFKINNDNVITEYSLQTSSENNSETKVTIKYGNLSKENSAKVTDGIKAAAQDALIPSQNIDNVPAEEGRPPAE